MDIWTFLLIPTPTLTNSYCGLIILFQSPSGSRLLISCEGTEKIEVEKACFVSPFVASKLKLATLGMGIMKLKKMNMRTTQVLETTMEEESRTSR